MTRLAKIGAWTLTAVLVILPFVTTALQLRRLNQTLVLVLAVLGVNLLTGYTGLLSLGHGVFVGIGAFATANFIDAGMPLWLAIPAAAVFTGAAGVILGLPALRVRGLYLAMITFGYALAFPPICRRLGAWTGGVSGRNVDTEFRPPAFLGIDGFVSEWRYLVSLAVVAFWFLITRNLVHSRVGRAMRAVRDGELSAEQFGVNIVQLKAGVLAISAAMTGTAGALQASLFPFVSQSQFDTFLSLRIYAAAVLGGMGTLVGAVFGVIALAVIPLINGVLGWVRNDSITFGLGLVIMTFVAPNGVAGLIRRKPAVAPQRSNRWWELPEDTLARQRDRAGLPEVPVVEVEPIDWDA